jgi:RHH-type rel operon transcriptional repressor/antitoxin RelB
MLNIPLEPELEQRLAVVAAKTGHSPADMAREAVLEMIEDREDLAAAEAVLANPGRRWTLEEIEAELDLKGDGLEG